MMRAMTSSSPGMKARITIREVAREAGVSLTTVSHALNDRGVVDPDTRTRVKAVAARLGYRPSARARKLQAGRSNSIAIVSSMPFAISGGVSRLGFMMEIAAIAAEAAMQRGLALVFVPPLETAQELLQDLDIDGAIVIEPQAQDPRVRLLRERGVSLVTIGQEPQAANPAPCVDLHSAGAARLLLEHLHAQGARHIALIQGDAPRESYLSQLQAYRAFVAEHGLPERVLAIPESTGEAGGAQACATVLSRWPDTDALCVPVDAFATGALAEALRLGRHVPDDLKLATRYDGLRARTARPALTAVDLHLEQVGSLAVELLFEHLSGHTTRSCVSGPQPRLVARASSGPRARTH